MWCVVCEQTGPSGSVIKDLQAKSGARITLGDPDVVTLSGTAAQVSNAKDLVLQIVQEQEKKKVRATTRNSLLSLMLTSFTLY